MAEQTQTRWDWLPDVATVGSILACYGTLAILGLLSLMGVSIALHEGAWASVISAFAILAAFGIIILHYRRYRAIGPVVLAVGGAGLVLWAMFVDYSRVVEVLGFVGLVAATLWNRRLKWAHCAR